MPYDDIEVSRDVFSGPTATRLGRVHPRPRVDLLDVIASKSAVIVALHRRIVEDARHHPQRRAHFEEYYLAKGRGQQILKLNVADHMPARECPIRVIFQQTSIR